MANKGKKQQEGSLDQYEPEAAPIYISQEPEQTLDDIKAEDRVKISPIPAGFAWTHTHVRWRHRERAA